MFRHVKFAELPVVDQDRAVAFYTRHARADALRRREIRRDWRWIEFQIPGAQTKILLTRREGEPREEPAMILVVEDVAKALRDAEGSRRRVHAGPTKAPWSAEETYALFSRQRRATRSCSALL